VGAQQREQPPAAGPRVGLGEQRGDSRHVGVAMLVPFLRPQSEGRGTLESTSTPGPAMSTWPP